MVSRRLFLQSSAAPPLPRLLRVPAAWAANAPGVTDAEIKIGQTFPYSGPASGYGAIARAEAAYFKMINEKGGVNGRKLNLISLDDGYSAPKTVEQTRRLIEQDGVAFIFQTFGGFTNLAVRPYLNDEQGAAAVWRRRRRPARRSPEFSLDGRLQPGHQHRGAHLRQAHPRHEARCEDRRPLSERSIGQDLPGGRARRAWRPSMPDSSSRKFLTRSRSPRSIPRLSRCRAPASMRSLSRQPQKAAAQTIRKVYDLGWTPERYLFFGAASIAGTLKPAGLEKSKGLITAGYLKDPTVPSWQDDPGFKEWAAFATKYMSPTDVREGMAVYGFTTAATMVHVLEQCGDDLSRENILRQALAIKDLELPMLLPGVKINTSPDNYFLIRQMQLARFNGEIWEPFGELISG